MNDLPIHITEQIFCFLPNHSLCYCALVSKSWNAVITPLLYNTVILSYYQEREFFYNTIFSPDQSRDLNALVREIHYSEYYSIEHDYYPGNMLTKDSADVFRVLPHIEIMIGYDENYVDNDSDLFLYDAFSKRLLRYVRTQSQVDYMTMISNNRTNMTGVTIVAQKHSSFRGFSGIMDFLQLFPQIRYLVVDYKETPVNTNEIFLQLLRQYPNIEYLNYGPGLNTDRLLDFTSYIPYPSIVRLRLAIKHLTAYHISFILNTFQNLSIMKLTVSDNDEDVLNLFIRTFAHVYQVEWEWTQDGHVEDTRTPLDIMNYTRLLHNTRPNEVTSSKNIVFWDNSDLLKKTGYHIKTHNHFRSSYDCLVKIFNSKRCLFDFFRGSYNAITHLILNKYPKVINLNTVNRVFATLEKLELLDTIISTANDTEDKLKEEEKENEDDEDDAELIVNYKLISLSLPSMDDLESVCKLYPNTSIVKFNDRLWDISPEDFADDDGIYTVVITWKKVHTVYINFNALPSFVKNMVITRTKRGDIVQRWIYNTEKKKLVSGYRIQYSKLLKSIGRPILMFESRSIQNIHGIHNDDYFDLYE